MTTITAAKITGTTSVSIFTLGLTEANILYLILGAIGLLFSLANYHYEFEHNNDKEFVWSEIIRYMIFGFCALPAVYIVAEPWVASNIARIIIGVIVSYFSISIVEAIFNRVISFIGEYKK